MGALLTLVTTGLLLSVGWAPLFIESQTTSREAAPPRSYEPARASAQR